MKSNSFFNVPVCVPVPELIRIGHAHGHGHVKEIQHSLSYRALCGRKILSYRLRFF